jgi:thiamine biosynthesis protein ThiI
VTTWLLKPAELVLKGENRRNFERVLKRNLTRILSNAGIDGKIIFTKGRYYVQSANDEDDKTELIFSRLSGISGWAKAKIREKNTDDIISACIEEGKKIYGEGFRTFKVETRRTDKSFPLTSYELCCKMGEAVTETCALKVDIHKPDRVIHVEIREKAYIYSGTKKGLGGLPVGCAGKGLLLLSGGIDSPVAGFLMGCRGMNIGAVHFHSYPYTSAEAKQKVIDLAGILGSFTLGIRLYILNFTAVQIRIREKAPMPWTTILLRMAMMEAAQKAAYKINCKCLITGESLSQVASQTIENLNCTQNRLKLPVLRPLIGMNKESIIREAEKIGTFAVSIRPYEDCCTLFTPPHPVLYGNAVEANRIYEGLELTELIDESLRNYELVKC